MTAMRLPVFDLGRLGYDPAFSQACSTIDFSMFLMVTAAR